MQMRTRWFAVLLTAGSLVAASAAEPPELKFKALDIDTKIEIGYGVTVADVDGDQKPDIVLADKNQIVWYQNPSWRKHVIAEKLTPLDHVCIASMYIDGDGKAGIAVLWYRLPRAVREKIHRPIAFSIFVSASTLQQIALWLSLQYT